MRGDTWDGPTLIIDFQELLAATPQAERAEVGQAFIDEHWDERGGPRTA